MTLVTEDPTRSDEECLPSRPDQWNAARAAGLGGGAAAVSLALFILPALLIWQGEGLATGTWRQAVGVGAAAWLASLGGPAELDGVTVTFVPLLLPALILGLLTWSWHWLLGRRGDDEAIVAGLLPRNVVRSLAWWWMGYAACVLGSTLLALGGPARPSWPWLVLVLLLPPLMAAGSGTALRARTDEDLLGFRLDPGGVSPALRRSVGPALRGTALLMLIGVVLVVLAVTLHWERVHAVQVAVGGGGAAALVLGLMQVAALPNLAIWALSFLAGPGFSVVQGASIDWSGSRTGLMPLVPVLAAHPQSASFPWWSGVVGLVPVLVGAAIGRWATKTVARLASLGTKASTAAAAAIMTTTVIALLDLAGGSSLGAYRLADIGAPVGWLFLTLGAELVTGALVFVLWDAWRLRR